MTTFARKPNELIQYRYKLNKNHTGKGSISIQGVMFQVGVWVVRAENQYELFKRYIKSHANPKGILDEYIYDPIKEFEMKENSEDIKFVHRKKIYSVDALSVKGRKELEEIAKEYLIKPQGKINTFLIKCILKEQSDYKNKVGKPDEFFEETNKIPK